MSSGGLQEGLWILVMHDDVLLDGGGQLRDAAEHAIAQALGRDIAEVPFDHVEPRRGSRGEMDT